MLPCFASKIITLLSVIHYRLLVSSGWGQHLQPSWSGQVCELLSEHLGTMVSAES